MMGTTWALLANLLFFAAVAIRTADAIDYCSFEEGLCAWRSDPDLPKAGNLVWTVVQGKSRPSGPQVDHTLAVSMGRYAIAEGPSVTAPGAIARLHSQSHGPTMDATCFKFFYYLKSSGSQDAAGASLSVAVREVGELTAGSKQWQTSSDTGSAWRRATVVIPAQKATYEILLTAAVNNGQSFVAIDDIFYDTAPGACDGGAFGY